MTKKNSEQKTKQRGRLSSPLTTHKAKKQNTMLTVDIPPTQQTTEPPEPNANFKGLKACYDLFILNDIVGVQMCDQSRSDILVCSKFSAKLASLPRFITGKQLEEIGRMVDAIAWIIPKARSNYHNL
ncbi:2671_t:CDS:2 [Funneliformis geosporum]|nr:2671_t:CDS:2 [Funneliformis geosporum]